MKSRYLQYIFFLGAVFWLGGGISLCLGFISLLTFAVAEIPLILGLDEVFLIPFVLDLTPDIVARH